ncbi:leucyl/phenylalanyl-tRNA--protein transferase [Candidatus Viridilinea mediisalina]|uniref:Leucyl/phenylalanyl-tRNA--protein transferase n=1 Tax=Candidatus Viridilinea mediisalina TaxID=2024553 RepID=A0A2A6RIZ5_9CHLR|nr:leucyl/phenylalanyl-tRNA--protein transferase [Candidatus Viridilinea mediisalina]PDW02866.1 leucyl/phenylalanyl-tRNA--protein transferase [Candidatus Viridilinea mediisalina]
MLTPELLLTAYSQGLFPMADEAGALGWYEPTVRAIIPLESFVVPRRLARTVRSERFSVRYNSAFTRVMRACAALQPGRESTWISEEMIEAYSQLHRLGYAHSVESWRAGQLVGGLYGVTLGGLFAGESMFCHERDASKVALVHLVARLRAGGFTLLDSQYIVGSHMLQFGTQEISRAEYHRRLRKALRVRAVF